MKTPFHGGPSVTAMEKRIVKGDPLTVSGLGGNTVKTYLCSQMQPFRNPDRVVLWCPKTDAEARQIQSLLSLWGTVDAIIPNEENLTVVLTKLIKAQACVILLPLDRMNDTIIAPRLFEEEIITLHTDDRSSHKVIVKRLLNGGYTENANATAPGEFAHHGSIIDVVPPESTKIIRIEFGPLIVDSIREVALTNGKNGTAVPSCEIIPFRIVTTRQSSNWVRYLLRLPPVTRLVISDPDTYADLPNWEETVEALDRLSPLRFNTLRMDDTDIVVQSRSPKLYHGKLDLWVKDLAAMKHNTVLILTSQDTAIKRWWKEYGPARTPFSGTIIKTTVNDQNILEGFQIDDDKLTVWVDRELFGDPQRTKGASHKVDTTFLAELAPSDYVVHLDHGVGRFIGMASSAVEDIEREYFRLEYAENDKLLVPTDMAYKLDKYIGAAHPHLNRLHSASWKQMKDRVREDTKILAKDLLKIYALREKSNVQPFGKPTTEEKELAASFQYDETPDQIRTIEEIEHDLQQSRPMDRLICGDVGFGKTEVAIRAAFKAAMNGFQVVVLAPTTILVQQHYDTFTERLKQFNISIESLSRFKTDKEQREAVASLRQGSTDIVIGTHRLLSEDIAFSKLGLIIIDEEQRFGVKDKEKLKRMRASVHVLTMSATPIPRTLNFSLSALRDLSLITTPPVGRQAIETIIEPYTEEHVRTAIESELKRKGQVYYIHNNVETIELAARRIGDIVPKAKIGIAHGQMHERELARTMEDFDGGKTNILVVTTIIENGVDLPNVNTLVVENATKFGLAQLYQLRGRIGRSDRQATAYFFYQSKKLTPEAQKRLKALLEAKELGSGFQLALRDLEIRGIGNILGKEQHGQVTAIGLSLYTRLLNQAIEEIKNKGAARKYHDITIDLPIDIRIPQDFIPNERKRLRVYQELTNITTMNALIDFKEGLIKLYGDLPLPVTQLFDQMEIKILSQETLLTSIDTIPSVDPPNARKIVIAVKQFEPEPLKRLLDSNPGWHIAENTVKILMDDLGKHWIRPLKAAIRLLKTNLNPGEIFTEEE